MAVFSVNQNRHLYVANAYNASPAAEGTIGVDTVGAGKDKAMFFKFYGKGGLIKSDLIPVENLEYVKVIKATDMDVKMRKVKVALDSSINGGDPVTGQDYVLRIAFRQFYGMSDEDVYFKDAVVHVTAAMEADKKEFYKAMVNALNLAFSREIGATKSTNPYLTFSALAYGASAGSEDGIYIEEKEQAWVKGIGAVERVYFEVMPTTIYTGGDDVIWAAQDSTTGKYYTEITSNLTAVGNGKKIADLEWFCAGERGDQYRMAGYPNYIPTEYLTNPAKRYHVIELHFSFKDTGVNSYKSEKDITIAVDGGDAGTTYTAVNSLIGAINSAAGTSLSTLS